MQRTQSLTFRRLALCAAGACIALGAAQSHAQGDDSTCFVFKTVGRLEPEDYRKASARLKIVEDYHFGPMVESLIRPMQVGMAIGSDLDYTLWGYPNHHRALVTLVRLGAREKTDQPRGTNFTIDCYFRRALRIASDDYIVRMIYASYLGSVNRRADGLRQLNYVVESAEDSPVTHYNAGLIYMELGELDKAAAQAKRALELGYPRQELRTELQRRGAWPAEAPASAASAASATGGQ
ncbi:MAG: tetratricopeptide repeat protein [Burkholderiaceae bacterium]|nr:tetratricopeptide repeat protein [Burkholderiaceae bacterium]